jgi:putative transcriptional regulator
MLDVKPEKGDLLIAQPYLGDPNFERSVVYLVEHNEEGTFGFVLNKDTGMVMGDFLEKYETCELPVFVGGPVEQNTIHYILAQENALSDSVAIANGVHWAGNFEELMGKIGTHGINEDLIRFFIGYSGWSAGQLEEELEQKAWIICKQPPADLVFEMDPQHQWREILRRMGGAFKVIANSPSDPRLN